MFSAGGLITSHVYTRACAHTHTPVLSCHLAAFKVTLPPQGGDEKLDASAFVDLESTFFRSRVFFVLNAKGG